MESKHHDQIEDVAERRALNVESSLEPRGAGGKPLKKKHSSISAMPSGNEMVLPSILQHSARPDEDLDPKLDREIGLKLKSRIRMQALPQTIARSRFNLKTNKMS